MLEIRPPAAGLLAVAALLVLVTAPAPAEGQQWVETTATRQLADQEELAVEVTFGAGELEVVPADPGELYELWTRYDDGLYRPVREFETENGRARLRVGIRPRSDAPSFSISLKPWDFHIDLGGLESAGDRPSALHLALTRDVPVDLRLNAGASETDLELGGVPLRRLRLQTGASETELAFGAPNPVDLTELTIDVGVAELRATGLGNARFETLRVNGGIGDITLDFTGAWSRSAEATVKMGLGSLTLVFPESLGVRITRQTLLSSFTAVGFVREDGSYRTTNWSTAEHRLELNLDGALSSVEVEVERP